MPARVAGWYKAPVLLCLLVLHAAAVIGQHGNLLLSQVNGTLPNGASYQTSASQITQSNKQGLISSMPMVRSSLLIIWS